MLRQGLLGMRPPRPRSFTPGTLEPAQLLVWVSHPGRETNRESVLVLGAEFRKNEHKNEQQRVRFPVLAWIHNTAILRALAFATIRAFEYSRRSALTGARLALATIHPANTNSRDRLAGSQTLVGRPSARL